MDFLKDLSEAWSQRLRSPFIGSIALSFFAINWQPIWYLLFADRPVRQKFLYFDANTSVVSLAVLPIAIGVALALASPWLRTFGALWAQAPNSQMKEIQHNATHKLKILEITTELARVEAEANLQATQERAKIDAAKRLEEAANVGGEELKEEIKDERRQSVFDRVKTISKQSISDSAERFLRFIGENETGVFRLSDHNNRYSVYRGSSESRIRNRETFLEFVDAVNELREKGLIERNQDAISNKGYSFLRELAENEENDGSSNHSGAFSEKA